MGTIAVSSKHCRPSAAAGRMLHSACRRGLLALTVVALACALVNRADAVRLFNMNLRELPRSVSSTGYPWCLLQKVMFGDMLNGFSGEWLDFSEADQYAKSLQKLSPVQMMTAKLNSIPCANQKCCEVDVFFRAGTTDWQTITFWFGSVVHEWVHSFRAPPEYILDAGGTLGTAAMVFAALFPDAKIVSVEPHFGNYQMINLNTEPYPNVFVENAGLWSHNTTLQIVPGSGNMFGEWGYRVQEAQPGTVDTGSLLDNTIPGVTVAQLLEKYNFPRFDVVKMDIEGSERQVLGDDTDLSWLEDVRLAFVEVHFLSTLKDHGQAVWHVKQLFSEYNFTQSTANHGEQLTFRSADCKFCGEDYNWS